MVQGLRNLERRACERESGILSIVVSSTGGTVITVVVGNLSDSRGPLRAPVGFQFERLGRRLLDVEGLLSVLFRLSSSKERFLLFSPFGVVGEALSSTNLDFGFPPASVGIVFLDDVFETCRGSSPSSSAADPEDLLLI